MSGIYPNGHLLRHAEAGGPGKKTNPVMQDVQLVEAIWHVRQGLWHEVQI